MPSQGKHSTSETATKSAQPTPTKIREQQSQLDFELDFFEGIIQRDPKYIDVLRVHGNNLTLKGLFAEGLKVDRRIVELRPSDPLARYNLACSFSLVGKVDSALRTLRKAVELGYNDFRYMREDHDLDALRSDPRFRQMLREFEIA